eukprot:jgi/Astpho2/3959/e_gw1.00063.256.1_t
MPVPGCLRAIPAILTPALCLQSSGGELADEATARLGDIRARRRANGQELRRNIEQWARDLGQRGVSEHGQPMVRRNRQCVSVKRGQQGELPRGSVTLDTSVSGNTVYMEPQPVVALNNAEALLAGQEQEEELAILADLSRQVSTAKTFAHGRGGLLASLDIASARAKHAAWAGAVRPFFLTPEEAEQARQDARQREAAPRPRPCPVDLLVPPGIKVVAVTGPNTGGKTASLKALGLAALMPKAGLFIPVTSHHHPSAPRLLFFDRVLADVGDSQSLEQNLSTFSGHVRRMGRILKALTPSSLVLLDEMGSGTDPAEGAALAGALLERLADTARLTYATTHHAELKELPVSADARYLNASVEFDVATLRPTFRLLWGQAGQSNALEVAQGLGFSPTIVKHARELVQEGQVGRVVAADGLASGRVHFLCV